MQIVYGLIAILFVIVLIITIIIMIKGYKYQQLLLKVAEEISDGYIIFASSGKVTNFNSKILELLNLRENLIEKKNVKDFFSEEIFLENDLKMIKSYINKISTFKDKLEFEVKTKNNKILKFEIIKIVNNDIFIRYAIIIKDVTKTYEIIDELRSNQEMIANREKFATLGQLISGIVHSLKSPIFSITGELEGIIDLIREYESSVGDDSVTIEDHYEIASDMDSWLGKMKEQMENISDAITAIRSQVIALNNEEEENYFTVSELIKYIDALMKNNLKESLTILNFTVRVRKNKEIKGNLNGLVQIINTLIMNSIDSYEGKSNQIIDITVDEVSGNLEIAVKDTGKGIPKNIQERIFKEIIPTDSEERTGLRIIYCIFKCKSTIWWRYKVYY